MFFDFLVVLRTAAGEDEMNCKELLCVLHPSLGHLPA